MLEDDTFFITEVSLSDSGLARVAGALADHGGAGTPPGQRGWLRSWVTGWTHRLDVDPRGLPQTEPIAGVGRLAEAVVDVLLERRPLEQMRRWLSREVVGMLTAPDGLSDQGGQGGYGGQSGRGSHAAGSPPVGSHGGQGGQGGYGGQSGYGSRGSHAAGSPPVGSHGGQGGQGGYGGRGSHAASSPPVSGSVGLGTGPRFAARSMIRSVRLHQPASGIVESTVVVQDGPRVRAVALRFEQTAPVAPGPGRRQLPGQQSSNGFNWMCTALQFT